MGSAHLHPRQEPPPWARILIMSRERQAMSAYGPRGEESLTGRSAAPPDLPVALANIPAAHENPQVGMGLRQATRPT